MKVYKLTDQNMQTHNGFQWEIGVPHETSGEDELCGAGWLHCYRDPLLAVLMNPVHAHILNPRLFEGEGEGKELHEPLKSGFTRMTLVREIPVPRITFEQKVRFGILCAKEVYKSLEWDLWAYKWLSGEDRTYAAATFAATSASATSYAASFAAAYVAASAASVAASAASAKVRDTTDFIALAHRAIEEEKKK